MTGLIAGVSIAAVLALIVWKPLHVILIVIALGMTITMAAVLVGALS